MSDDRQQGSQQQQMPLTSAQKETARRLNMTEKQYATNAAELIRRGKIKREDIR